MTYAGPRRIEPADVLAVLGVTDSEQLFDAVDAIVARDPAQALRAAAALGESGRDPGQVLRDLEVHARELLAVQVLGDVPAELRVTPERDGRLTAQAGALAPGDAVRLLDLVAHALEATSNGGQARIQLELVLVKAAAPELDPSRAALVSRIERLEGGARRRPRRRLQRYRRQRRPRRRRHQRRRSRRPLRAEDKATPPGLRAPGGDRGLAGCGGGGRAQNAMLAALLQDARPVGGDSGIWCWPSRRAPPSSSARPNRMTIAGWPWMRATVTGQRRG